MTKRTLRSVLFVAAMALPSTAGHSQTSEQTAVVQPTFGGHFAPYRALPDQPEPGPKAVDLDSFDPPIEVEPEIWRSGVASYYGAKFNGRRTASGERFDMNGYTAAHRTLPFGSKVLVTNPSTGKSVTVRINDRGPFSRNRTIDLSRAAAQDLGLIARGHGTVELALVD